jgi:hypothetical protein
MNAPAATAPERVAYHEAGHAVAALAFAIPILYVTVEGKPDPAAWSAAAETAAGRCLTAAAHPRLGERLRSLSGPRADPVSLPLPATPCSPGGVPGQVSVTSHRAHRAPTRSALPRIRSY